MHLNTVCLDAIENVERGEIFLTNLLLMLMDAASPFFLPLHFLLLQQLVVDL